MRKIIFLIVSIFLCALFEPKICSAQQNQEQLASQYFNNGDYEQAIELYEVMYKKTSSKYYYQMLYRSYMALKRYKDVERLVDKMIKKEPTDLSLYVDLGDMLVDKGEAKKAEKAYASAIDKLGTDAKQLQDLVVAYDKSNRLDFAVKAYQKVRQSLKSKYIYVMDLASLYGRMGKYDLMMQEYFDLMDNAPGNMSSIQISLQRALLEAPDNRLAEGLRKTLVSRIQAQPNNKQYLEMMIWFSLQQKDFEFALTQAKSVDLRFPEVGGEQILRVASIALNNGDYVVADEGFSLLVKKGSSSEYYYDGRVGSLQAKFAQLNRNYPLSKAQLSQLGQLYVDAFNELGKTEKTVPLMREYASLMAYYANDVQAAADILYDVLDIPRLKNGLVSEVKLELGDVLLFAGEIWDASLLYMQVEKANKHEVIGAMAKLKNAKLSYYNHDFLWAKSQLDVLRASTSKLVANDAMQLSLLISDNMEEDSTYDMLELYASADLLLYQNQLDSAWIAFDDITHKALSHPLFDEVLLQKAKIRMRQSRYEEADSLLQQLIDFYPQDILADDALFMLAELNQDKLNNMERANACYERIILDYPSSLYVDQARKRYKRK